MTAHLGQHRADLMHLGRAGRLHDKVALTDRLGSETVIHAELTCGSNLIAALARDAICRIGTQISLGFDPAVAHLFAAQVPRSRRGAAGGAVARPRPIKAIRAKTRSDTAFARLIRSAARDFANHLAVLMALDDPEGPHKARVALRRLRATLTAFRPLLRKKAYVRLTSEVRDHAKTIGRLRDADVLAQALGLPDLRTAAAGLRAKSRTKLWKSRAASWASRLPDRFAAADAQRKGKRAKAARRAPVERLATAALNDIWRRCKASGPDLSRLSEGRRHALRKSLKTLRYLCDQFRPVWPGADASGFLRTLSALQDDLGRLNDHVVARAQGLALPDDPALLPHAQGLWHDLRGHPVWWRRGKAK